MISEQEIQQVRSFNRLVTRQVGALSDRYLGRLPLGEARVLFEIRSAGGATPRDIRARLGLDSGYLSRVLASLRRHGLVREVPNPADRRSKRRMGSSSSITSSFSMYRSPKPFCQFRRRSRRERAEGFL